MAVSANIPFGAASRIAGEVDSLFLYITGVTVFFFIVTQGLLIYFAFKYRKKKGEEDRETKYITSNRVLEGIWIGIPTLLVMSIFAYGYKVWDDMRTPLQHAEEIHVTAQQWLFRFKYPDGREAINELRVPVNQPIQLTMTSKDVIHAFYIPEFRVKQDILPGRYTYVWLKPDVVGTYTVYCTQYCGMGHSNMLAKFYVMSTHEYNEWYQKQAEEEEKALPLPEKGKALVEKNGCLACHSIDGTFKVGPTWKDLYGSPVKLTDGRTVTANDDYIRESILDPNAKIVQGYKPVMPTFKGILSDDDITAIIAYIKTLK